jgi:hypothetical protein
VSEPVQRDIEVARARADTYRLLGRLCLAEVDARILAALRETPEFGAALACRVRAAVPRERGAV